MDQQLFQQTKSICFVFISIIAMHANIYSDIRKIVLKTCIAHVNYLCSFLFENYVDSL